MLQEGLQSPHVFVTYHRKETSVYAAHQKKHTATQEPDVREWIRPGAERKRFGEERIVLSLDRGTEAERRDADDDPDDEIRCRGDRSKPSEDDDTGCCDGISQIHDSGSYSANIPLKFM